MNLQERFLAKSSEIVSSITLGSSFFQNQSAFKIRSLIEIFGNDFFVKMHLNFLWERERYNIYWFLKKRKMVTSIPINSITVIIRGEDILLLKDLEKDWSGRSAFFGFFFFSQEKPECRFSEPLFPVVKIIQKQPEQRIFFSKRIMDELKACKL